MQLELLAERWTSGEIVDTPKGPRLVRRGTPTQSFWRSFRGFRRQSIFAAGISARKNEETGKHELVWMTPVPPGWSPVSEDSLADFRDAPGLCWDTVERARRAELLSHIDDVDPSGLLTYQVDPTRLLAHSLFTNGVALDASDPGVGKTYMALGAIREFGGWRARVLCPKSVLPAWTRAGAHMRVQTEPLNYEMVRTGNTDWGQWHALTKTEKTFEWTLPKRTVLVFDEAHACRGAESRASAMLTAALRQGIPTMPLSATLAMSPLEMYSLGMLLGLHSGVDFHQWCLMNGCVSDGYGLVYRGGPEGMLPIHRAIFPDKGERTTVDELGAAFPSSQITAECFDCNDDGAIQVAYDEMEKEIEALAERAEEDKPSALTVMTRARQHAELLKVPTFVELTKQWLEEGLSVPVFFNFNDSLMAWAERVGTDCLVYGGNKRGERQVNIDRFQRNESWTIGCNAQAGGQSIDLHDVYHQRRRGALISPCFSAIVLRQILGRVRRSGGTHSIQRIVFAAGSVEEQACSAVQVKLNNLTALNDGDLTAGLHLF